MSDNPIVLPGRADDEVRAGGNFHGMPVAVALDTVATALVSLASISERRLYRLLDPKKSNGLPAFLVHASGLNSGLHAGAVHGRVARERVQVARAPGVGGFDPLVRRPGGPREHGHDRGAARARDRGNAETVLALEALAAAQALDLRAPLEPGAATRAVHDAIRTRVPFFEADREFGPDIAAAIALVRDGGVGGRRGIGGGLGARLVHVACRASHAGSPPTNVATTGSWPGR